MLDVEVLLFDGFDEMDAVGPYEVLANGARRGADLSVRTVTYGPAETVTAGHGMTFVPDATLGDPDLLVVPGGGWTAEGGVPASEANGGSSDRKSGGVPASEANRGSSDRRSDGVRAVVEDGTIPQRVAEHHAGGGAVASVCTGAMVLAEAGILAGRPATTHHVAGDDLAAVADRVDARVVDDGDVVTCGGVTSGIDMALYLLEREFGADVADGVAREMEHERSHDIHRG